MHRMRGWNTSDRHRADLLHGLPPGQLLCFGDCDLRHLLPWALLTSICYSLLGMCCRHVLRCFGDRLHRLCCWNVFNDPRDCLPELSNRNILSLSDKLVLKLRIWVLAAEHWCIGVRRLLSGFIFDQHSMHFLPGRDLFRAFGVHLVQQLLIRYLSIQYRPELVYFLPPGQLLHLRIVSVGNLCRRVLFLRLGNRLFKLRSRILFGRRCKRLLWLCIRVIFQRNTGDRLP